jgi:hypothetical protein
LIGSLCSGVSVFVPDFVLVDVQPGRLRCNKRVYGFECVPRTLDRVVGVASLTRCLWNRFRHRYQNGSRRTQTTVGKT